jgi:3-hydroxyisobutyrate dehydrogenase
MAEIGIVGLGRMGGAMLARLAETGHDVAGWDAALAARAASGPYAVAALAATARPLMLLSLPDAAAVAAVLAGLWPMLPAGAAIADTSTIGPGEARRFAAEAAARGFGYADCPVSGGPAGAAAGTLSVMAGGEATTLERLAPLLAPLAARVAHVGPPGAGAVAKLVNNLLVATHLAAAGEAMRLAARAGVAAPDILPVINAASGRSAATEVNWPRWVLPGAPSGFSAGLMRKDVRLALAIAEEAGVALDLCARAAALWEASAVSDAADFNDVSAELAR